jgi:hypothetical protein
MVKYSLAPVKKTNVLPKLHSIGALLRGRQFEGAFEVADVPYRLVYAPSRAVVEGQRFQLIGSLTVTDSRPNTRVRPQSRPGIRATLASIQSGIGAAPPRKKLPPEVYPPLQGVPGVDSSGSQSFSGVLYFLFEPLPAAALGLKADISRVQLNARLFPEKNLERALQAAYSQVADALLGKQVDRSSADEAVAELNRLIAG